MQQNTNKKVRFPFAFATIYGIILFIFTLYTLLDTFVIPKSINKVDYIGEHESTSNSSNNTDNYLGNDENSEVINQGSVTSDDNTYKDDNIQITITTYYENDTSIYVADIILNNSSYLKTALANNTFGKNITATTSTIANQSNSILAINGDFYGARSDGFVMRNGVLYRSGASNSSQEDLVIYDDGHFSIEKESNLVSSDLVSSGAKQVLSFGPGLLSDGKIIVDSNDEVGHAMQSNPRTAIGIIDDLHYVMVVSDGRTNASKGLTLYQLSTFMQDKLNVKTAYNLDGGGSSSMVFNGKVVNKPTTNGRTFQERKVSDIVYIGYK